MREETKKLVAAEVSRFIDSLPTQNRSQLEKVREQYPFHAAIFSEEALLFAKQERSAVTKMGMTLFPNLARIVAKDKYVDVHKDLDIPIEIDAGSLAKINSIVSELRTGGKKSNRKRSPDHNKEIEEILSEANGKTVITKLRADLYVGDYSGGPLFIEIKSPMPNLDVCAQSKEKVLVYETAMMTRKGRAYFAFPYNPWITRDKYAHSFTKSIMDMGVEVLMGNEMWDVLGGPGTWSELLREIDQVGQAKRKTKKQDETL